MAKVGKGKVTPKIATGDSVTIGAPGRVTVGATSVVASTAIVLCGSALGIPIMREGFTTETGLVPPSIGTATAVFALPLVE